MERINIHSGSKWEEQVGYSRAVRLGNIIEVSGTVASDEQGNIVAPGNAYGQTVYIYKKIEKALQQLGASLEDVVRVRMFVTDIAQWEEYAKGHSAFFLNIKPCNTMVEVSRLIEPGYLVEIETTAILRD